MLGMTETAHSSHATPPSAALLLAPEASRALDHPARARIYSIVLANPGVHRAALVERLGLGNGATRHHLDVLVGSGLLMVTRPGGFVRYFPAGVVGFTEARREGVLRAGCNRAVFAILSAEPLLTLRAVGARLGISAPSVHRAVKRLREAGLLPPTPRPRAHAEASPDATR